ncbi:MAG: hypothetical protein L0Z50_25050, partial [Verrucomicrobiales bacterium]|nr:hypothetical protein [Verrucomicrobiales bacterium]
MNPDMQALGSTGSGASDRECLESWARHRDAESLQALVERYLGFVHSSALRRTGDAAQAAEVTRGVFLVLTRRARRLRKKTALAGWLFHVTSVACRKLKRMGRLQRLWHWISRRPRPAEHAELMEICGAKGVETSPLTPSHELERDCAESQSQRAPTCCGWSATQPRSGSGVPGANFGSVSSFPDREGNLTSSPPNATLWARLAPQIDRALERLRTKQRNAVLLCAFLN